MKFKDYIYSDFGFDLSYFEKYIIKGSVDSGLAVIEFTENDVKEIVELIKKSYFKNSFAILNFDNLYCFGSDGYMYKLTENGVIKTDKRSYRKFNSGYRFTKSRLNRTKKAQNRTKLMNDKYSESLIIRNHSFLPFKSFEFYSKEHGITLKFRFRPSESPYKPLVIYLPGAGCFGYDNIKQYYEYSTFLRKWLKFYDCSVLLPQPPMSGNFIKPTSFDYILSVKQLADRISEEYSVDKSRIYLIGTSYGGWSAWKLIYNFPDYFACGLPVMGSFPDYLTSDIDFSTFANTPLWVAHSSDDDNVPIVFDDYCVKKIKQLGIDIKYSRWDKYGHKMCNKFYKNEPWAEWMFKQKK